MLSLTVPGPAGAPLRGHLVMGEEPGVPGAVTADSRHLWRGGRPWFPVSGEFHYARYPAAEWREELLKIRAGGVTAVATYVFWNVHEARPGRFDWSGDRDLRRFVTLCAETGLDVVARIGPWAHGESRHGGFPDWLLAAGCEPRTDDPRYLALVRRFYAEIGARLRGLLRRDGGPVVAVQLENELHDRPGHLLTLKRLARECGIDAPLWTATGWGHARLPRDEVIPLFGGYPEAAWDTAHDGPPGQSRAHYFFGHGRDDDSIGADLRAGAGAGAPAGDGGDGGDGDGGSADGDLARYPFATCELGGGMFLAYHRRPLVGAADVAALALVKLGSGSAWQGYYLYHGASQAEGLQESHATGYPNDCPAVDYDFQAPLGQYGQFRESWFRLRLHHLWLASDGGDLAPMTLTLPPGAPAGTADRRTLRWAVRSDGRSGFLFVNNHEPAEALPAHDGVRFRVLLGERSLTVPREPVTVPPGAYFAWPLARPLGDTGLLVTASAQPVCTLPAPDPAAPDGSGPDGGGRDGGGRDGGGPVMVLAQVAGIPVELTLHGAERVEGPGVSDRDGSVLVGRDGPGVVGRDGLGVSERDGPVLVGRDGPVLVERDGSGVVVRGLRPGPGCLLRVTGRDGRTARVLVLDERSALGATRARLRGADRLLISDRPAVPDGDRLFLYGGRPGDHLRIFPPVSAPPPPDGGVFEAVELPDPPAAAEPVAAAVERVAPAGPPRTAVADPRSGRASAPSDADFAHAAVYRVPVPARLLDTGDEVLLRLDWTGDAARALIGGRLVADRFWHGPPWEIGLRRHRRALLEHGAIELRLLPWPRNVPQEVPVYVSPQVRDRLGAPPELRAAAFVPVPRTVLAFDGGEAR
ncbi:beta-galactosidase [Nonomuraea sp. NPDC050783]|uniref:beta-galactosidase n=1 Tax=Nonomuraea sp. NPDC050783 TaxID=3154634 RepID=UPI003466C2A0